MKAGFKMTLVALNAAALLAGYLWLRPRPAAPATPEEIAAATAAAEARAAARAGAKTRPTVIYRTNAFNWSQVESSDYREYIANLRAIRCPEATIKDIILTDVMRLYAQRRGQHYQNGRAFKYWETDEKQHLKQAQLEEREKALAEIDRELPAVLRELLGINYEREVNKYFVDTDEDNRRLAFLSDAKRDDALALREKFEGVRERAALTNADKETLRQIDEDQDAAFGALLTSEEKEQYDLSLSPAADRLRSELVGFNPTEDEFKDLFRRRQAIEAAYALQDPHDPATQAARAADEQAALDAFKGTLTPDRAAQLAQAQDPDYRSLCALSERFDLPADTSTVLVEMRHAAESEKQVLLANRDLPSDRLDAALKAIQSETEKAARQALGEQAYQLYSQSAGWIQQLGRN
ncbi:MAG TPA: hypothetical protein VHB20_17520 [Verrucomicrobiae bacterium]|nr:hypothetical protein [Verrucomicrobiae bacterium]